MKWEKFPLPGGERFVERVICSLAPLSSSSPTRGEENLVYPSRQGRGLFSYIKIDQVKTI
jgi:hypothetical protein